MPIPEHDNLGPMFEKRLKAALDRVTPPSPMLSSARYRSLNAGSPRRAWRVVPALVGIGAALMALSAAAATGSPNPAVWTERAGSVIQNVGHIPASTPKTVKSPKPSAKPAEPANRDGWEAPTPSDGRDKESPEPKESPEASPRPQPSERAEPSPTADSEDHGGAAPSPDSSDDGN